MWDVLLSGKLSAQYPTYTVTTPEVGRLLVERPGMVSKMVGVAPFEQIEKVRPQPQRDQGGEQHGWPGPGKKAFGHGGLSPPRRQHVQYPVRCGAGEKVFERVPAHDLPEVEDPRVQ